MTDIASGRWISDRCLHESIGLQTMLFTHTVATPLALRVSL